VRTAKTPIGILGRTNYGFAAHVEACIDQRRTTGSGLEGGELMVNQRVALFADGLYARPAVDVLDGRERGVDDAKSLEALTRPEALRSCAARSL